MSVALAKNAQAQIVRVPEARVIAMISSCATQIEQAASIDDAKEVTDMAEAIAAITRKVNVAKEVKRSAVRLLVDAEAKLGEILRAIPRGTKANGLPAKRDLLVEHGINKRRASFAQRLSCTPSEKIDRVIEAGAQTLHGVTSKLALHTDGYAIRAQRASMTAFLCEEAVGLLERSVKNRQVPHAGTVADMAARWRRITAHGNAR